MVSLFFIGNRTKRWGSSYSNPVMWQSSLPSIRCPRVIPSHRSPRTVSYSTKGEFCNCMNTLEQAILGPIRSELIGHDAIFCSSGCKTIAKNITEVDLDGFGKSVRIVADNIVYDVSGKAFETNQHRFHISSKYLVTR